MIKLRFYPFIKLVAMGLISVVLIACGSSSSSSGDSEKDELASVRISIPELRSNASDERNRTIQKASISRELVSRSSIDSSVPGEIDRIVIDVVDSRNSVLDEGDILAAGGDLMLRIKPGKNYRVRGKAFAGSEILFSGEAALTSIASNESISINLSLLEQVVFTLTPQADIELGVDPVAISFALDGLTDIAINWYVNDTLGGSDTFGFIDAGGSYSPPAILPADTRITITAEPVAAPSFAQSIAFNLLPAPNQAPSANAGPDQTVNEGVEVTLDGSGSSDPESSLSTYLWEQLSGSNVNLSNTGVVSPTFTAPDVAVDQDLVFQLTVTDDGSLQDIDTVTIRINNVVTSNADVFFGASTDGFTHTLWKSDGTTGGTQQLNNVLVNNSDFAFAKTIGDYTYFRGRDAVNGSELWRTNGTVLGTEILPVASNDNYFSGAAASADPNNFAVIGDRLIFAANTSQDASFQYSSTLSVDATLGTIDITDFATILNGRPGTGYGKNNNAFAAFNGYVYFSRATFGPTNYALYRTDGINTAEVVIDGLSSQHIHDFTVLNGELFFVVGSSELWKTDGTTTTLFKTFSGRVGYSFSSDATFMPFVGGTVVKEGRMFFVADDGDGRELWSTNGISENATDTLQILDLDGDSGTSGFPFAFRVVNGNTVFFSQNGSNTTDGLWVTDGTLGGTTRLTSAAIGDDVGFYSGLGTAEPIVINVGGTERLFFAASDGLNGAELWVSDGTLAGTTMVRDINVGAQGSQPAMFLEGDGYLIFSAQDADGRAKLWRSDGTIGGTALILDICSRSCFENGTFFSLGG